MCIAAWAVRLGFIADLLSQPILIGYMAGVAVIMIASQLGTLTGIRLGADSVGGKVMELGQRLDEIRLLPLALGGGVAVFLLVLKRLKPLAPGTLIGVVAAGLIVWVFGLEAQGVAVIGAVPGGLPAPVLPAITLADGMSLLGGAAAITFVGYSDVALTGRAFAARTGEQIDPNQEFLALGVANVAAGLTGGFALSASGSRTAIIDAMRAHSQMVGLVAAVSVVFVVLAVPGLIALIPRAALGGVVVFAALRLIDVGAIQTAQALPVDGAGARGHRVRRACSRSMSWRASWSRWGCRWWSCSPGSRGRRPRCWDGSRGWPACTTSRTTRTRRPSRAS